MARTSMKPLAGLAFCAALSTTACSTDTESDADTGPADTEPADTGADAVDATADTTDTALDTMDEEVDTENSDADASPEDTVAPTFRDVRFSISGAVSVELDLNAADRDVVAPWAVAAEFSVIASDDVTSSSDLMVEVRTSDDSVVAPDASAFDSGVWSLTVEVVPGESYRVVVTDEAGNTSEPSRALALPSLAEAMADAWEQRQYNAEGDLETTVTFAWDEAGTWAAEGSGEGSGSWSVEGERLVTTFGSSLGIERILDAYVDGVYLDPDPYALDGTASGWQGEWTRSWDLRSTEGGTPEGSVDERLTLAAEGVYAHERTVSDADGAVVEERTESGTWVRVPNESYTDTVGDFLVRTVTSVDEEAVEPEEIVDLARVRGDRLLVSPLIRAE